MTMSLRPDNSAFKPNLLRALYNNFKVFFYIQEFIRGNKCENSGSPCHEKLRRHRTVSCQLHPVLAYFVDITLFPGILITPYDNGIVILPEIENYLICFDLSGQIFLNGQIKPGIKAIRDE